MLVIIYDGCFEICSKKKLYDMVLIINKMFVLSVDSLVYPPRELGYSLFIGTFLLLYICKHKINFFFFSIRHTIHVTHHKA